MTFDWWTSTLKYIWLVIKLLGSPVTITTVSGHWLQVQKTGCRTDDAWHKCVKGIACMLTVGYLCVPNQPSIIMSYRLVSSTHTMQWAEGSFALDVTSGMLGVWLSQLIALLPYCLTCNHLGSLAWGTG